MNPELLDEALIANEHVLERVRQAEFIRANRYYARHYFMIGLAWGLAIGGILTATYIAFLMWART